MMNTTTHPPPAYETLEIEIYSVFVRNTDRYRTVTATARVECHPHTNNLPHPGRVNGLVNDGLSDLQSTIILF